MLLVTVVFLLAACVTAIFILECGPSEAARVKFVKACYESSRLKRLGKMFLSEEEYQKIISTNGMTQVAAGISSDISAYEQTTTADADEHESEADKPDPIEIIDVSGWSFKGKLMIIHDPSRIFAGTVPQFGHFDGMTVAEMMDDYTRNGAPVIGGINGGDFIDNGMNSSFTAQPIGAVISEGEVVYADSDDWDVPYHLAGFDKDNHFIMGNISLNQAMELEIRDAIYCKHETGPFLVMDGEALVDSIPDAATYGSGPNPRTAIGQRADMAVLLLVVDGRQANSLGASFEQLAYVMRDYGAINACAMDGGTSSQMIYDGEIISHPYSAYGIRRCPTSWLIRSEDSQSDDGR